MDARTQGGTTTGMTRLGQAHSYATLVVKDYMRAKRFYGETLGLQVRDMQDAEDTAMVMTAEGSGFTFYRNEKLPTPQNTVLTFVTDDFDGTFAELEGRGVTFEDYDIPEMGIRTMHGVAEMGGAKAAWFKDSEGNILNLVSA